MKGLVNASKYTGFMGKEERVLLKKNMNSSSREV